MKNILLIVNALLVLVVGYLLYDNISKKSSNSGGQTAQVKDSVGKRLVFAYIDIDSIQQKYELAKAVQKEIKTKENNLSGEFDRLERSYKNKIAGYQQKAATMTEAEANAARQDIETNQNQIMEKRQSMTDEFNQFVASKNMSVMKKIQDYLKEFNKNGAYSFIFSYEPALFYYKDSTFDITQQVLKGLNQKYSSEKK